MKVHQTLVLLNLLSFRTYDLTAPTIGIQSESAANHNTLLRHFDLTTPAYTVPAACLCNTAECVRGAGSPCRTGPAGIEIRSSQCS